MIEWWAQLECVPPGTRCNKVLAAVPVRYTEHWLWGLQG